MSRETAFVTAVLLLGTGCATTIRDVSRVLYVAETFHPESLRREGLALLPVTAGAGQEGYRRPMGDALAQRCAALMEDGRFLTWQETMEILNEKDLADVYDDLIETYRTTSILRREAVRRLAEALRVRYLLFASLERFHTRTALTYNIISGLNTQRKTEVSVFCQVWDGRNGDVVWEGAGVANSSGGELTYDRPYEVYADVAAKGVVRRLFQLAEPEQERQAPNPWHP
jgi:hypothetical protein